MRLELARSAGFCYGVRRAVQMAEMAAEGGRPCVMLGPIIHNRDVIAYLESIGVGLVDTPEEVPPGAAVLIRSHGEGRPVHEALARLGRPVIDATCPNVSRIHQIVSRAEEGGRQVLIIGTCHPSGGGRHRRMVPAAGGCWRGRRSCRTGWKPRRNGGHTSHYGLTNHLHPFYLGFLRRKSKKRVYKLKNF